MEVETTKQNKKKKLSMLCSAFSEGVNVRISKAEKYYYRCWLKWTCQSKECKIRWTIKNKRRSKRESLIWLLFQGNVALTNLNKISKRKTRVNAHFICLDDNITGDLLLQHACISFLLSSELVRADSNPALLVKYLDYLSKYPLKNHRQWTIGWTIESSPTSSYKTVPW